MKNERLKDELIFLEGQESIEDGGKRLETSRGKEEKAQLKQKEEVNQMVTHTHTDVIHLGVESSV